MKILHIAPFNIAGVPLTFVKAERALGHESRLVTLGKSPRGYAEDICLDLPFLDFWGTRLAKYLFSARRLLQVTHLTPEVRHIPLAWKPNNIFEKLLIQFREKVWQKKINAFIEIYRLFDFDVYQLDGGLGFYRNGRIIRQLKQKGKKIICCYTGSDLRRRGVIPQIDKISDLNITVEFDHQQLHPNIHHVFFPFDCSSFKLRQPSRKDVLIIGHAPTSRAAKGSNLIIHIIRELEKAYPVKMLLIENLPYAEAIRRKAECDIFIDQLGDLGYGINSLEALAMGIPTCSCLAKGFEEKYPDHPFIVVNAQNLKARLIELIEDEKLRLKKGIEGRKWVAKYHDSKAVVRKIHQLLSSNISEP